MELNPTFSLGLIVFLGIFSQWFAWKISRPAIVVMSIAGLLLGPILQIVVPANVLGDDIYKAFVSMAVALILFEGSLSLNVKEIRGLKQTIKRIVFVGAFLAWILGSLCAYFFDRSFFDELRCDWLHLNCDGADGHLASFAAGTT